MASITWTLTPTVKEVTLPSGNSYYLKDEDVRNWVGTGSSSGAEYRITELETAVAALSNATHWLGITTTSLEDGSTTNPITINGASVTAVSGDIVQDVNANEFIFNGTAWQQFGGSIGTLKAFAFVDTGTVTIQPAGTNSASSVTFGTHTTTEVLKSDVVATVPKTSSTTKYLKATVGNAAIGVATDGSAITNLGTPSTETVVKSYPGATSKMETTSIPNVTSVGTAASWSATVSSEVLTFSWTANTPATLGTAITAATGTLDAAGTGASVMTGLGTPTTESVVTGYASPTTDTFAKTVSVTTQPTVTLSEENSSDASTVPVVTDVSTSGTDSVTFTTTGHTADAITAIGTATAAAQTFTGTSATHTVYPST